MAITAFKLHSVLEYEWGEDLVRFELFSDSEGCMLVLKEMISRITDHTSKDLAGWHVCLDFMQAQLDGKTIENRTDVWKIWYEKYVSALEENK